MTKQTEPTKLWTPQQVAEVLQISVKTVYKHSVKLGGFYPFGIGRLRFDGERIQKHILRAGKAVLEIRVPLQKKKNNKVRVSNRKASRNSSTRPPEPVATGDSSNGDDRDNLLRHFKRVS